MDVVVTRNTVVVAIGTVLVALGVAALLWPASPAAPPHVVLVMGCTVRRDQVTPYGGPAKATPFLAEVAAQGTVFEDAIAAAPWTRPAAAALLTGDHAVRHGFVRHLDQTPLALPDDVVTLAQHFSAVGYRTVGATANPNLDPVFGFARGFDAYQEGLQANWKRRLDGSSVVDALLAQVDGRAPDQPLYLQAMLMDAHAPRKVRPDEANPFTTGGVPGPVVAYRATLARFDAAVARLVSGLAAQGIDASNTVFVVIADHGEGLGFPAHHGRSHGSQPAPSVARIPWILWGGPVDRGHRIEGMASGVDLLPTLLGLADLPAAEGIAGMDHSRQVRGRSDRTDRDRSYVDTWFRRFTRAAIYTDSVACQDDFGSRQPQRAFEPGCFDRRTDPEHANPIPHPEWMADLRAWRTAREADLAAADPGEGVTIDPAMKKQLEMLGYVE